MSILNCRKDNQEYSARKLLMLESNFGMFQFATAIGFLFSTAKLVNFVTKADVFNTFRLQSVCVHSRLFDEMKIRLVKLISLQAYTLIVCVAQ